MKLTDQKIDEILSEMPEDVQLPDGYEERIDALVKSLLKDPAYPLKRRRMPVPAAIVAICVILFSSVTVGAAISKLQERMEAIPESEILKNVSELESANVHADSFSRTLSEQEKEQMRELEIEYERNGRFPEGELRTVESESEIPEGELAFAVESSTFFLPDEPLSDEEMLEIIDFMYKRDFSLEKAHTAGEETEIEPAEGMITEEEAVQRARELAEILTGMDMDFCEAEVEDQVEGLQIKFRHDEDICAVYVMKATGEITEFELDNQKVRDSGMPVDESLYREEFKTIVDFLILKLGIAESFDSAFCIYGENADGTLYGSVSYCFIADGTCYVIKYSVADDRIIKISISAADEYLASYKKNSELLKKEYGVQIKRIDFISSTTKEKQEER